MSDETKFPWRYCSVKIQLNPEAAEHVRRTRFRDPATPVDARNHNRQARAWFLPGFIKRRIWPVTYDWLTWGELIEKRRRQTQDVLNRGIFGDVFDTPQSTTFDGIAPSKPSWR